MGTSPGHGPHHSPPRTASTSQAWRKGQTPAQEWKILGTHQVRCPMPPTSYRCQLAGPSFMCQGSWGQKPQGIHPTWLSLVLGCARSALGASWVNEQMDAAGRGRAWRGGWGGAGPSPATLQLCNFVSGDQLSRRTAGVPRTRTLLLRPG